MRYVVVWGWGGGEWVGVLVWGGLGEESVGTVGKKRRLSGFLVSE